ncbi:MAG: FixH family protein [Thiobacillaceae bacterium]|nr:FixH family protein [Thiobacillaceae bacterium]MDW8322490.1 FixH family protein [Burkholderiales bacterium]
MHGDVNDRPWWKEPMLWLIVGLPAAAVVAGLITWKIAADGADSLVAEDYYKQGMAIHQTLEKETRAAALGLTIELSLHGSELRGQLHGRLDSYPDRLLLNLVHPARAEQDVSLVLTATDRGEYRATLPALAPGPRRVVLQPENEEWRLSARAQWPLDKPLRLGEGTTTDSTTPSANAR